MRFDLALANAGFGERSGGALLKITEEQFIQTRLRHGQTPSKTPLYKKKRESARYLRALAFLLQFARRRPAVICELFFRFFLGRLLRSGFLHSGFLGSGLFRRRL